MIKLGNNNSVLAQVQNEIPKNLSFDFKITKFFIHIGLQGKSQY